jgi:hypothetical protein
MFCDRAAKELGETGRLHALVMVDAMKLKSGFFSNFKNGMTTVMAASLGMSTLSLATELQALVESKGSSQRQRQQTTQKNVWLWQPRRMTKMLLMTHMLMFCILRLHL